MITLYQLLAQILYFVILPFAWIAAKSGSIKWRQRMAFELPESQFNVWLHAASVGEVKIASHLINYLRSERPSVSIFLSVVTDNGYRIAKQELGAMAEVHYFPVDAAVPVALTLDRVQPKLIGITETEIWPNFLAAAKVRNIPVILVNGRMSEKARRRYRWIKRATSAVLNIHEYFFFKTQEDAERYREFGVQDDRAAVAGDMKFDAPVPEKSPEKIAASRRAVGVAQDAFFLVAGSTRPGEEELLCRMYAELQKELPRLRLLLAPRHVDRVGEIRLLIEQMGLTSVIYGESNGEKDSIIIVDRMGILGDLYMAANLAFVGGTLVDIGGHNILEPVWCGTPVVYGPSLGNVIDAAHYIESGNFGRRVETIEQLTRVVADVYHGRMTFAVKSSEDFRHSPTAMVGAYILKRLGHV